MLYKLSKYVNGSKLGNVLRNLINHLPIHLRAKVLAIVITVVLFPDVKNEKVMISGRGDALIIAKRGKDREIYLSINHVAYLRDVIRSFDYYFYSVAPQTIGGTKLVDFSHPRDHDVIGFNKFPIHLPSLAEPISTNLQYIQFARLTSGDVVFDLGAYAGLSSIMFKEVVGKSGVVVAVEADPHNAVSCKINLERYHDQTQNNIELVEAAIWSHSNGIHFTSDGNMGSSATEILGNTRGDSSFVETMTLSNLAFKLKLNKVNLIKCDIEGDELMVFKDVAFFSKYRPRIIIEPHFVNGELTSDRIVEDLKVLNYAVREVIQNGVDYPLLECIPN